MTHEGFSDVTSRALAHELKYPLVEIARRAELSAVSSVDMLSVQQSAEQALRLIDSYLLSAQSEYGQQQLELQPLTAGSILYDASLNLSTLQIPVIIDDRAHDPIMSHRLGLTSFLELCAKVIGSYENAQRVVLRSFKTRSGEVGVGVLSEHIMHEDDLKIAQSLAGRAHMPLARLSSNAHVSLLIADNLSKALGGTMQVKKMGRMSGFVTTLPRSEQFALL